MSLYQTGPPRPKVLAKPLVAPAPVLDTGFAIILRAESLLAVRTHRVADLLFVFALVILPMVAMIALLFLLSSGERPWRSRTRWMVQACSSCRPDDPV
jgi:hypothetical protein